jgi:phosphate transport system substrate-binding protein
MRRIRNTLATALLAGLLGACAPEGTPESGGAAVAPAHLSIKGSDTMVHLVTAWAEAYMAAHPEAQISVTGGGSGTGIAAMINGTTDVCMASRKVKPREVELARERGVEFHEVVVARDGIAVVVHPENPVEELTLDQLRQIFNGTLRDWKQVGGPKRPLQVLSRESNSGTYVFFNEHVLRKDDYAREARLMPSNAAIVQAVSQDRGSIGYVGLGYAEGAPVRIVRVKADAASPAVAPSLTTVRDGSYPIARPLHLYANGEPKGLARDFIEFALSPEGQRIVRETGYIPVRGD